MFKCLVIKYLERIMSTQAELALALDVIKVQVGKIGTETQSLKDKVAELVEALAAAGAVSPEVEAALEALKAQVQVVDDLVVDAP
jgi:uncharacterized protein YoxC